MKLCYLLGLFLLAVLVKANEEDLQDITKNSETSSSSEEEFYNEVKEILEKKCKDAGGEHAFDNLKKALEGVKTCVSGHLPKNTEELKELQDSSEESSEDLCTHKRQKVRECFNGAVVEALENCSDPDEKFLPHFLYDAIEGILDYICANEEAFIGKVINSLQCVGSMMENSNLTDTCDDHLKVLKSETPEDMKITKEELCHDLKYSQTCYGEIIAKECPDSQLKDLVSELYGAVNTACDKKHKRSIPTRFLY